MKFNVMVKNRHACGERHGMHVLTEEKVRLIRSLAGRATQQEIAKLVGVTKRTVGSVIRRERWGHIADDPAIAFEDFCKVWISRLRERPKRPHICQTCHRDTKSPLFDGCMAHRCPYGFRPCL